MIHTVSTFGVYLLRALVVILIGLVVLAVFQHGHMDGSRRR